MKQPPMVKLMDKIEKRLKDDAALFDAVISPELRERIRNSVESTRPVDSMQGRTRIPGMTRWWASGLTGLAAAGLVIVLVNWKSPPEPVEDIAGAVPPGAILSLQRRFPLNARTAEWTAPLQEEMKNLQSDLEKARVNVERDLRLSF